MTPSIPEHPPRLHPSVIARDRSPMFRFGSVLWDPWGDVGPPVAEICRGLGRSIVLHGCC